MAFNDHDDDKEELEDNRNDHDVRYAGPFDTPGIIFSSHACYALT